MFYLKYPCRFIRVPVKTYRNALFEVTRIYYVSYTFWGGCKICCKGKPISSVFFKRFEATRLRLNDESKTELFKLFQGAQKVQPKTAARGSDFLQTSNESPLSHLQYTKITDKEVDLQLKLIDQGEVRNINKREAKWREIKIDYSKLGKYCASLSKFRLTCKFYV